MTRPPEPPPVAKETLGWVCSSIVRSPVVSTIFTLGPPDTVCVSVELGQLVRKTQAIHTHERQESRAPLTSRIFVRESGQITGPCSDIFPLVADHSIRSNRCRQESHACQIIGSSSLQEHLVWSISQSFPPPRVWATLEHGIVGRFAKAALI